MLAPACLGLQVAASSLLGPPSRAQAHQGGWGRQLLAGHATSRPPSRARTHQGGRLRVLLCGVFSLCWECHRPGPPPERERIREWRLRVLLCGVFSLCWKCHRPGPPPERKRIREWRLRVPLCGVFCALGRPLPCAGYTSISFRGWFPDPPLERKASKRLESPAFSWTCHHPAPSRARTHQGGRLRVPLCGVFCTLGQASPFGGIFL